MAKAKKQAKVKETARAPRLGAVSNLCKGTPEEVAGILHDYGLEAVQLLPSFEGVKFSGAEDITTKKCHQMADPFHDAELMVAGVSAHTNFIDPERSRRKKNIKRFDALIEHCGDFGVDYLVTETGTLAPSRPWDDVAENHAPATFAAFLDAARPSVKLAETVGVKILFECHLYHVVSSAAQAARVREELGEAVGFVMDPANLFTRGMIASSPKQLQEIFKAIGADSPVAHAKDVRYVGGELTTPRAGTGSLDYKTFLELLDQYQPECPLIIEQIRPAELRETMDFIDRFFP